MTAEDVYGKTLGKQRHFVVEFPVTQVEVWRKVTPPLKQLVHQSMGDDVEFEFIKRAASHRHADNRHVDEVIASEGMLRAG